ncbi:FitA-like ribbon-helix-helix domain-containing protein [Kineococcus sp. SYSU DK004]|uniref:FitA-like ribbon-helix-helix domain-containing protein n=1 Tax=Kineococcus sp. SYSU DK004 TaxID=3383125 RepID=UPI003D7D1465
MPSAPIEDVPDETHAAPRRRAARAHQSPQERRPTSLVEEEGIPALDAVLERAGGRAGGSVSFRDAVEAVREDRDGRS